MALVHVVVLILNILRNLYPLSDTPTVFFSINLLLRMCISVLRLSFVLLILCVCTSAAFRCQINVGNVLYRPTDGLKDSVMVTLRFFSGSFVHVVSILYDCILYHHRRHHHIHFAQKHTC